MLEIFFNSVLAYVECLTKEDPKLHDFWEVYQLLNSDEDRYNFLKPILQSFKFPEIPASLMREKSSVKSQELREAGNDYFKQGKLCSALRSYTESIAFAPPNSETLCLAHGNRSAALKSLGLLRESVREIDCALALGYPASLAHKLHQRRAECLALLGEHEQAVQSFAAASSSLDQASLDPAAREKKNQELKKKGKTCKLAAKTPNQAKLTLDSPAKKEPPPLSYGINTELNGASDCIALQYNEKYGRHLVATRDIQPGDTVIVEKPYSSFLKIDRDNPKKPQHEGHSSYIHCSHCFERCPTLLPCPKCVWAMFCSEECRQAAHYHDFECSLVPTLIAWDMGFQHLYLLRILSVTGIAAILEYLDNIPSSSDPRTRGFTGDKLLSNFNAIYNLVSNSKLRDTKEMLLLNVVSWCLVKCMGDLLPDPDRFGALFLHLIQVLSTNSEGVGELYMNPGMCHNNKICIGGGIYVTFSYLNHSCDYNCSRFSVGNVVVIQASQPIKKGSMLTITYYSKFLDFNKLERRAYILARFQFECHCEACDGDWPMLAELHAQGMLPVNMPNGKNRSACERAVADMQDVYQRHKILNEKDLARVKSVLVLLHKSNFKLSFAYQFLLGIYGDAAAEKGNYHQDKFL